jgi:hypothetical protein
VWLPARDNAEIPSVKRIVAPFEKNIIATNIIINENNMCKEEKHNNNNRPAVSMK